MRKIYFILLLSISIFTPCLSQSLLPAHASSFITGLNGRSTEGPSWDDADFIKLVHEMNPSWMRYPAGTQANYWDWRTGTFIEGSDKKPKYSFTIEQCVKGLPLNTKLIYVVNMARPTPATGISIDASADILRSEETLRKKAQDILEALAHFESLGHLPEVVEFGNEFYFGNEHAAIYARDNALYIAHSKILSEIIKTHYPEIGIILCMTKYGTNGRNEWNNAITEALSSDPVFASRISGVVQHHYLSENYGSQEVISNDDTSEAAILEALTYVREQNELNKLYLPANLSLWLTEYGASKNNATGTWASGIRSVLMSMAWLESSHTIETMLYHHITADPDVIQKLPSPVCGPVGVAFGLMMNACKGKNRYERISFPDPGLYGLRISDANESGVFVVNMSRRTVSGQNIDVLLSDTNVRRQDQYYSYIPYNANSNLQNGIAVSPEQDSRSYTFYPYSVSWIRGEFRSTSTGLSKTTVNYRFDKNDGLLTVFNRQERPCTLQIYDFTGKLRYNRIINMDKENIDLSSWNRGIYLIRLHYDNEICSDKFKY